MSHRRKRKRNRAYLPGYLPPGALAWCALHDRGINASYMRQKHCLFNHHHRPCKHLKWLSPGKPKPERS